MIVQPLAELAAALHAQWTRLSGTQDESSPAGLNRRYMSQLSETSTDENVAILTPGESAVLATLSVSYGYLSSSPETVSGGLPLTAAVRVINCTDLVLAEKGLGTVIDDLLNLRHADHAKTSDQAPGS